MRTITLLSISITVLIVDAVFMRTPLGGAEEASEPVLKVTRSQNTNTVPLHEVFEITFQHEGEYANPFFDVTIEVTFQSPSGRSVTVGGFHYGSSKPPAIRVSEDKRGRRRAEYQFEKQDLYKARFAPNELGQWRYAYVFSNNKGAKATGVGEFNCVKGRTRNHGFVRQHPTNPFRWVFDDGTPYFPIGLQEGWGDWSGNGTALDMKSMEGPFRTDRTDLVELPGGPLYVRGPSSWPQNADVYARRHSRAGFNLYRFSQRNNTYNLYRNLDHYLVQEGVMTDEILQHLRKYGFRIFYGFFGFGRDVFNDEPDNAEGMAKVKRFVKYSVDRWGAYVDFWEFLNERKADDRWHAIMTRYLKSIDPYRHPITNWQAAHVDGIDFNSPHDYYGSTPRSDIVTVQKAKVWKALGKPVILGEHGNWVAFFHEIAFIFWNTSYARDGHYMNIWLGPQERQYIKAMQDFAYRLDKDVKMVPATVSQPDQVRAYGLASSNRAAIYLHHFKDHTKEVRDVTVTFDAPIAAKGYWYSTENAAILGTFDVPAGKETFEIPPFIVDLALLITPNGAPDIDHDGIPNDRDPDDDNDGVADEKDAFPLEPEEWRDTDGDGIGDNADIDDDGDGWSDAEERSAGTNPLDRLSFPEEEHQ
ncbi:MAG TPA: DUF5060 domain-containing protein [Desulfobacterales bacterium]|nr:DUF5060 domain-containing protein [Desulfobacterales bacterium]